MYTLRGGESGVPLAAGVRAEAGGESIDDGHTEIQRLLRRYGDTDRTSPGSTTDRRAAGSYHHEGHTSSFADLMALRGGSVLADYRRFGTELARLAETHRVDPEHPEAADGAAELDRQSLAEWVGGLGLVPEARFVVGQANTSLYNAELADLSLLYVLQQVAAVAGVPDAESETMRVAGGNSTLPDAIAADLRRPSWWTRRLLPCTTTAMSSTSSARTRRTSARTS